MNLELQLSCDNCDGRGWLELDEFREATMDEILGDETDLYWLNGRNEEPFEYGLCPDCDGCGIEQDQDYSEDLDIMKMIDRHMNYRGFGWAYLLDIKERKTRKVIYFQWRRYRKNLLILPSRKKVFED
jgi:hypothetical protein